MAPTTRPSANLRTATSNKTSSSKASPGSASSAGSGSAPSWTLQEHVEHLTALLTASPAAEELQTTWDGFPTKDGANPAATSNSNVPVLALGLKHYKAALDSGRRISSASKAAEHDKSAVGSRSEHHGLPLWIVVRTLKASWHADGSWPLLGSDADEAQTKLTLPIASPGAAAPAQGEAATSASTITLPRSNHPSVVLIKAKGPVGAALVANPEPGPPPRPDPMPDQIAAAYRARGICVPDPEVHAGSDEEEDSGKILRTEGLPLDANDERIFTET